MARSITQSVASDTMAVARAIGKPTPGFCAFIWGYAAWFWRISGMVKVNPSTSSA